MVDDQYVPTVTQWMRLLNDARQQLAKECLLFPEEYTFSSQANINARAEPANQYAIRDIRYYDATGNQIELKPLSKKEYEAKGLNQQSTSLLNYYEEARNLYTWPMLSTSAYTDTLAGSMTTTATTVSLVTGTSTLPMVGTMFVDTEVIGWSGKDDTTFALKNLSHGLEGTTAAAHSAGSTVTFRDVKVTYFKYPSDLTTTASTVEDQFAMYPKLLEYYACWKAKEHDLDDGGTGGASQQSQYFAGMYQQELDKFKKWIWGREDETFKIRRAYP
jgi:hypothetical protein